jgi:RimJ/RimL family protein N-acetyltransferase
MVPSSRLTFLGNKTAEAVRELWLNNFAEPTDYQHMHAHVPAPFRVPNERSLHGFLVSQPTAWLIQRTEEQDIIGFILHGNYGGLVNNIGFNIGLKYIQQGYASEAIGVLLDYLRARGFSETFGQCLASNAGSIRTMEACGFENSGKTGRQFNGVDELTFRCNLML